MTFATFLGIIVCMIVMAIAILAALRNTAASKAFDEEQQQVAKFELARKRYIAMEDNIARPFPILEQSGGRYRVMDGSNCMPLEDWDKTSHRWRLFVIDHKDSRLKNGELKALPPRDSIHKYIQPTKK